MGNTNLENWRRRRDMSCSRLPPPPSPCSYAAFLVCWEGRTDFRATVVPGNLEWGLTMYFLQHIRSPSSLSNHTSLLMPNMNNSEDWMQCCENRTMCNYNIGREIPHRTRSSFHVSKHNITNKQAIIWCYPILTVPWSSAAPPYCFALAFFILSMLVFMATLWSTIGLG